MADVKKMKTIPRECKTMYQYTNHICGEDNGVWFDEVSARHHLGNDGVKWYNICPHCGHDVDLKGLGVIDEPICDDVTKGKEWL